MCRALRVRRRGALSFLLAMTTLLSGCVEEPSSEVAKLDQVVVLLATVQSLEGNEDYPVGEYHSANLFVRSDDRERAAEIAAAELEKGDLRLVAINKIGIASPEQLSSLEPIYKESYEDALRSGFAAVVYDDPSDPPEMEGASSSQ